MKPAFWSLAVIAIFAAAGCQRSAAPPAADSTAQATSPSPQADPKQQTEAFLSALFAGDDVKATAMLTRAAQQACQQAGFEVQPPGSPGARFEVTEATVLKDDPSQAHAWSVVSDTGEGDRYDIVWLLRREGDSWAISGMATVLFGSEFVLDFENAQDLLAKRQWAQQQASRVQAASAGDSASPASTAQAPGQTSTR